MTLYHWNSVDVLKEYSPGDIIVSAESVEQAREKATEAFKAYFLAYYDWLDIENDDKEQYISLLEMLKKDLSIPPVVVDSDVVLIRGSQ